MGNVFNFETRAFFPRTRNSQAWPTFLKGLYVLHPTNGKYVCHDTNFKRNGRIRVWHSKSEGVDCPSKINLSIEPALVQPENESFSFKVSHNGAICTCKSNLRAASKSSDMITKTVSEVAAKDKLSASSSTLEMYPSPPTSSPTQTSQEKALLLDKSIYDRWRALKQSNLQLAETSNDKLVEVQWKEVNFGEGLSEVEQRSLLNTYFMFEEEFYKTYARETPGDVSTPVSIKRKALSPTDVIQRKLEENLNELDQEDSENLNDMLHEVTSTLQVGNDAFGEKYKRSLTDDFTRHGTSSTDNSSTSCSTTDHSSQKEVKPSDKIRTNQSKVVNNFFGGDFNAKTRNIKKEKGVEMKKTTTQESQVFTSLLSLDFNKLNEADNFQFDNFNKRFEARETAKKKRLEELAQFTVLDCKETSQYLLRK